MIHVFTTVTPLDQVEKDFTWLGEKDGRQYYVSSDYIDRVFKRRGKLSERKTFYAELEQSELGLLTVLELWLDVIEADIVHFSVEEVEKFIELYEMRDTEDLFLNLGEKQDGESKSIGETIFVNSLADIIQRGR